MIDNQIDQKLRQFSSAVAHISPDVIPLDEPSPQPTAKRPAVAFAVGFALVALVLGSTSVAFLSLRGGDSVSGTAVQSDFDAYWDWMTEDAIDLDERSIGVTRRGSVPEFDASALGEVQRIVSEATVPVEGGALEMIEAIPPVAYVGWIEGTTVQVVVARPTHSIDGDMALCTEDRSPEPNRGAGACTGGDGLAEGELLVLSHIGHLEGGGGVVAIAMLPRDTALVALTLSDGRVFVQRPVGGVTAFVVPELGSTYTALIDVLDAAGETILMDSIGPG